MTIRINIQYLTNSLQLRTDRVLLDKNATTDQLKEIIASKLRCNVKQLFLKFKRDGYTLKIIEGWTLDFYEIGEGTILYAQELENEEEQYKQAKLKYMANSNMQKIMRNTRDNRNMNKSQRGQEGTIITSQHELIEEEDEDKMSDQSSKSFNGARSFESNSPDGSFATDQKQTSQMLNIKKLLDSKLEEMLKETKEGHYDNIIKILQDISPHITEEQKKQYVKELVNENGMSGWNPLHFAVYNEKHINILKMYIEKGGDINKHTADGWTPLEIAVHKSNIQIIRYILTLEQLKINDISSKGTALHIACRNSNSTLIQILLDKGADPSIQNDQGLDCFASCIKDECLTILRRHVQQKEAELQRQQAEECNQKKLDSQRSDQQEEAKQDTKTNNANNNNATNNKEGENFPVIPELTKKVSGSIGQPKKPPVVKGIGYKHGDWIWTLRTRYYVMNPEEGTFIRYKRKEDYPMKPLEVIPLIHLDRVQTLERSWYMKDKLSYFEFSFNGQRQAIGFQNIQTAKKWVLFIKEGIRFAIYCEEKKIKAQHVDQSDVLELMDITEFDDQNCKKIMDRLFNTTKTEKSQSPVKQRGPQPIDTGMTQSTKHIADQSSPKLPYLNKKPSDETNNNNSNVNNNSIMNKDQDPMNQSTMNNSSNMDKSTTISSSRPSIAPKLSPNISMDDSNADLGDMEDKTINFKSFTISRTLGVGAFGQVFLAEKNDDKKVYAIKALKKKNLILKKQLKYAVTEANVLKSCDHPFVLKLHFAFQTPNYLYLVMDYCSGGDLSQLLAERTTFPEDWARFYIMELILAIEHIHSKNVVYRDLKPENILIEGDGHIKLADFGLAKDNIRDGDNTKSFCGSPAYLSPEMLNHHGAGKASDLYGVGCVLYEMMTGDPPYYNDDIPTMYKQIKEGMLRFPSHISRPCREIAQRLLDRNPQTRLGARGFQEIKDDPFFNGYDWNKVLRKQYTPPITEFENQENEEEQLFKFQKKQNFTDTDYTDSNAKVNRVIKFTFVREEDGQTFE